MEALSKSYNSRSPKLKLSGMRRTLYETKTKKQAGGVMAIRFKIYDKSANHKVTRTGDFYVNGEGKIFRDCDPCGIDLSGYRRIMEVSPERYEVTLEGECEDGD